MPDENTDRVLGELLDEAHHLRPPMAPFDGVRRRARRRAAVRRAAGVAAAVLVFGAGAVAAASGGGDDRTRVAVTDMPAPTDEEPATTTTTVPDATVQQPPTSATPAEPAPTPQDPPPPSSTTTTDTAPPHPDDEAPAAFIQGDGDEVQMKQGSSCWRPVTPNRAALCSDAGAEFADDAPTVRIERGGSLTVRWSTDQQPTEVRVIAHEWEGREPHELRPTQGNPSQVVADLAPGEYVLFVFSTWSQGDVLHGVRLVVTAPAA